MPPSPGYRSPKDSMKDSILKESTSGWSNAISPLRIAKRDSTSKSNGDMIVEPGSPGKGLARRQSNSYKHVWNNNLVSRSPFKSSLPTPMRESTANNIDHASPRVPRKISGEKRPRPESLIRQADAESEKRTRELGFKRRQSKAFQGLVEKEPVTKSPFRRIVSPIPSAAASAPISIALGPALASITDDDTTSLEEEAYQKEMRIDNVRDVFGSPQLSIKSVSPGLPLTPQNIRPPSRSPNSALKHSPMQGSPVHSASQPSPTRSSLVSKRLIGPRSVSGSPSDTPWTRERRKTVTFDELCDVVEFDRASHEDMSFETDDEAVYGKPSSEEEQLDITNSQNPYESDDSIDRTPKPPAIAKWSPHDLDATIGEDSINGLMDSMLQEASVMHSHSPEPSTPTHQTVDLADDEDLMNGGGENGVPHGRIHHTDRRRLSNEKELPMVPDPDSDEMADAEDEPSFSSISLSTPPQQTSTSTTRHSLPQLPPDTEQAEDGMRLGRSHHAERAMEAHKNAIDPEIDKDVRKLPPSPSPLRRSVPGKSNTDTTERLIPKFDIGLNTASRSPKGGLPQTLGDDFDDVFNTSSREDIDDFEAEFNRSVLSNTSIASFHEILPQRDDHQEISETDLLNRKSLEGSQSRFEDLSNVSFNQSDISLSKLRSFENLLNDRGVPTTSSSNEIEVGRAHASSDSRNDSFKRLSGPDIVLQEASMINNAVASGSLSRSPRINRESVRRRLEEQRSGDNTPSSSFGAIPVRGSPMLADDHFASSSQTLSHSPQSPITKHIHHSQSPQSSKPGRSPLQDRLKNALSPSSISAPLPLEPSPPAQDSLSRPSLPDRAQTYDVPPRPPFDFNQPGVHIGDMKSALDRLVEDVNTGRVTSQPYNEDADISMADTIMSSEAEDVEMHDSRPPVGRAYTAPEFNKHFEKPEIVTENINSVPPRNALDEREQKIKEIRRRLRARESGDFVPTRRTADGTPVEKFLQSSGRPSRRRSLSTGDAEDFINPNPAAQRRVSVLKNQLGGVLGVPLESEEHLGDSIEEELMRLSGKAKKSYHLKEHDETIYASSSTEESISHMKSVGDIEVGKAWRTVRRPSDMNEYARQIREYRSLAKSGKVYGKVFVRVLAIKSLTIPLPPQTTFFTCTLHNGIHFVTTPEIRLERECRIDQEFELIEHAKLEFSLSIKIRRDPHVITQINAMKAPPSRPQPPRTSSASVMPQSKSSLVRNFFSTPKRPKQIPREATPPLPPPPILPESLGRYLQTNGTLAAAFVSFKEIASHCDMKLFETMFPLMGQRLERIGGSVQDIKIGQLALQIFRLPPLPGVPPDQLPQSLEECHLGLRHIYWHKQTYHEGTLTQLGADCTTWRRRRLRVIGANIVAFNDVTKRATATIDLKKAIAVEDDQEINRRFSRPRRDIDEFDGVYGVERSFRLVFPNRQEISFFADSDEEKSRWLEILRALVGHIPPNPLWAELLWQRQQEESKNTSAPLRKSQDSAPHVR